MSRGKNSDVWFLRSSRGCQGLKKWQQNILLDRGAHDHPSNNYGTSSKKRTHTTLINSYHIPIVHLLRSAFRSVVVRRILWCFFAAGVAAVICLFSCAGCAGGHHSFLGLLQWRFFSAFICSIWKWVGGVGVEHFCTCFKQLSSTPK